MKNIQFINELCSSQKKVYHKLSKVIFLSTLLVILLGGSSSCSKKEIFQLKSNTPINIFYDQSAEDNATTNALQLLIEDIEDVFSIKPSINSEAEGNIWIGTYGINTHIDKLFSDNILSTTDIEGKKEAFILSVININEKPTLVVVGSDKRGTAYGLMEVSRMIGVSPWKWWADVTPNKLDKFTLDLGYKNIQSPSVPYRGIFLNDEDWGLMPWSNKTLEPSEIPGNIGPKTYERIFQLLIRLRANTLWPAMHECTRPFFLTEGNKEMAHNYGIFIGGSHCEPMMRSTAGEWPIEGEGDYDYVNNSNNVYKFWENRVRDVAHMDNIYTLGMRGVHDGKMQGAKTLDEQKEVLVKVLNDQRNLLRQHVNKEIEQIPQVFIPYKEVLDIYRHGLSVDDDITLMWCDDNYGYIRHFPTEEELKRKGGHGMYYHVSYWGRPHDYLWLGTANPALLYEQMRLAYEKGIREMWILNVGDIKPIEYQTELFLDMAWDIENVVKEGLNNHLSNWLKQQFGSEVNQDILSIMHEHYRLAYICKPEFLGNTREEERENKMSRIVKDLPWSEEEIRERLENYKNISDKAEKLNKQIPDHLKDAYFELIKYPIQAATQMNNKLLVAQLARHNKAEWKDSEIAYDSIVSLTKSYNSILNGKWNFMMDHQPRKLPPFEPVKQEKTEQPLPELKKPLFKFNGTDYSDTSTPQYSTQFLGYEGKALAIQKGSSVSFDLNKLSTDSICVEIHLLPNHPINNDKLSFEVSFENNTETIEYQTYGRTEEWKQNVLRNQAIRTVIFPVKNKKQTLSIKAIDEGVVLDQIFIYDNNVK